MVTSLTGLPKEVTERVYNFVGGLRDISVVCPRRNFILPEIRIYNHVSIAPVSDIGAPDCPLKSHGDTFELIIINALFDESKVQPLFEVFRNLRQLELLDCKIPSGIFLSWFQRCQNLETFALTGTTDLQWLLAGRLDNLESPVLDEFILSVRYLSLRMNKCVTNRVLEVLLARMPNIESLCLASCTSLRFKPDEGEQDFQSVFTSLTKSPRKFVNLDFSYTTIDNDAVTQIVNRYGATLQKLDLTNCEELTSEIFETIARCGKLESLSVPPCVEFTQLKHILCKTPELEHLKLDQCAKLTNPDFSKVILENLLQLEVSHCSCVDNNNNYTLCGLEGLATLNHLTLRYTGIDVALIQSLASLKNLQVLRISHSWNFNDDCFSLICSNLTQLEEFYVEGCTALNRGNGYTTSSLKLKSLFLYNLSEITSEFFGNGFGSPNMEHLTIWDCPYGREALVMIGRYHRTLKYLTLFIREGITDQDFTDLVSSLDELQALRLYGCRSLTDQSLDALKITCPKLLELDVSFCRFSDDAEKSLCTHKPNVCFTPIRGPFERRNV